MFFIFVFLQTFCSSCDPTQQLPASSIMYDPSQNSYLESDDIGVDYTRYTDYKCRVNSFRGSGLTQQPAERMARAGFYFTGDSDCVRCFSCQKTVENWNSEDSPVERHKEVIAMRNTFLVCLFEYFI